MSSAGSFQYQIVLCSSLYVFSRSIAAPQMHSLSINFRVLICCTCHFRGGSPFFVYLASSVCKSLQCLISALTQGGKGGRLCRLTCSIVLHGGRNTANKYHWCVWGVLAVPGPRWVCPRSQCVCFPGLHCSGSRLLYRGNV